MKKTLSLILAMLLIFSTFAMSVAAEEETTESTESTSNLVTVTFVVDGQVVKTIQTEPGIPFIDRLQQGDSKLDTPVKPSTATTKYTFRYWECKEKDITATTGNLPPTSENITYVAVFAEEEIRETQSFFKFIESVFARINEIFRYFAKVFEGVFEF